MIKRIAAALMLGAALVAAGCGGGSTSSPEDAVSSAMDALAGGTLLAEGFGVDFDDIEVKSVKENGDTATVVTDSPLGKSTVTLVKQGDEWLINDEEG